MNPETQPDPKTAIFPRRATRRLTWTAAALMALGVVIIFIPSHESHWVHLISGIAAIVAGLNLLGWTAYFRRRLR
jgi:drug/metabolite transporter (DMT)-like permease